MKTLVRSVVLICGLALPWMLATAQITITAADVQSRLAVGNSLTNVDDSLTTSINIGSPGSSSWDFSGLKNSAAITVKSVVLTTTPYANQFSGATHALQTRITYNYSGIPITGDVFLYLKFSTTPSNLQNLGMMGGASVIGLPIELKNTDVPGDVVYALPSTLNSTWKSVYTETQRVAFVGGSEISSSVKTHDASYLVDGYGPMKMPDGKSYEALRMIKVDYTSTGKVVTYIFLAKNFASVQVTAKDTLPPNSGTIPVSLITWSGPIATDVQTAAALPTAFSLAQNYPNPFNPSTTIHFAVPKESRVSLKVFNLLGSEVATLVNRIMPAGEQSVEFNAGDLASGVYLYRLESGDFVQTRKMVLTR